MKNKALVRFDGPITLTDSEPEPDIAVVRLPLEQYRQHHPYPEDIFWLVEISDLTLDLDLNEKKRVYAAAGIQEYWVIAVKQQKMIIFRHREGDDYLVKLEITQGTIVPLAFADITVSVDRFLGL